MSKMQKIYRVCRREGGLSREEARYAAPKIVVMTWAQLQHIRAFGA